MKYEELEFYTPSRKPPSNFKDLTGTENDYFKIIGRAPNSKTGAVKWNCQCKACGEYCVKFARNLKQDKSCGCQKNKLIGKALRADLTGKRFGHLIALNYTGKSNTSGNAIWHCKCDCGNECDIDSNNLTSLHTTSCGCIKSSIGADYIEDILKINNILFKKEVSFPDLYHKSKDHLLRFDFCLYNEKNQIYKIVEYDGIQHYMDTWGNWARPEGALKGQQERDKIKNEWAKNNNIPLVRIPYWERDNITLEMIMGDKYLVK